MTRTEGSTLVGTSGMDPFDLILGGEAERAIEIYSARIKSGESAQGFAGRALALLNLGRLEDAKSDYMHALDLERKERTAVGSAYLCSIGSIYWMQGHDEEAARIWLRALEGINSGEITHSDMAGGAGVGALLWFAGARSELPGYLKAAEEFLRKNAKGAKAHNWPGPIGGFLLGQVTVDSLQAASEARPVELMKRRRCQAAFYVGAKALTSDDSDAFRQGMARAVEFGASTMVEKEYYLARYELSRLN